MNNKKIVSMAALIAASLTAAQAQTTIAGWTFDNYPSAAGTIIANPAPSTGSGTASALGFNNSYNSTTSISSPDIIADVAGNSTGSGLNDWRLRGQTPGNGWSSQAPIGTQGAEFAASTVGYSGIQLTFDISTTKQAPANLEVLYTIDGSTWLNATLSYAGGNTATVLNNTISVNTVMGSYIQMQNSAGGWYDGITANLSGVSGVNNDPNFAVEIVNASTGVDDINQAGTAYNNSSGNWRLDNVVIGTVPVPEPSTLALAEILGLTALVGLRRLKNRQN
jgi:hypothetical protein